MSEVNLHTEIITGPIKAAWKLLLGQLAVAAVTIYLDHANRQAIARERGVVDRAPILQNGGLDQGTDPDPGSPDADPDNDPADNPDAHLHSPDATTTTAPNMSADGGHDTDTITAPTPEPPRDPGKRRGSTPNPTWIPKRSTSVRNVDANDGVVEGDVVEDLTDAKDVKTETKVDLPVIDSEAELITTSDNEDDSEKPEGAAQPEAEAREPLSPLLDETVRVAVPIRRGDDALAITFGPGSKKPIIRPDGSFFGVFPKTANRLAYLVGKDPEPSEEDRAEATLAEQMYLKALRAYGWDGKGQLKRSVEKKAYRALQKLTHEDHDVDRGYDGKKYQEALKLIVLWRDDNIAWMIDDIPSR